MGLLMSLPSVVQQRYHCSWMASTPHGLSASNRLAGANRQGSWQSSKEKAEACKAPWGLVMAIHDFLSIALHWLKQVIKITQIQGLEKPTSYFDERSFKITGMWCRYREATSWGPQCFSPRQHYSKSSKSEHASAWVMFVKVPLAKARCMANQIMECRNKLHFSMGGKKFVIIFAVLRVIWENLNHH